MRRLAFIAPIAAVLAVAASTQAQPSQPRVSVEIGPRLQAQSLDLGREEVRQQADRLAQVVAAELNRSGRLDGAQVRLVLTDLKPNRPTFRQVSRAPGLSQIHSIALGGAAVDIEVTTADGQRRTGQFEYFTQDLRDVQGFSTWQDADRAYTRLATGLADGRVALR